jgi:hypothetical protein
MINWLKSLSLLSLLLLALAPQLVHAQENPSSNQENQVVDAPNLLTPSDSAVTTGYNYPPVGVPTLMWTPVAGAERYNVQISSSLGFADPLVDNATYATAYTPIVTLADGTYYWRVRAGQGNSWGAYSDIFSFTKDWSNGGSIIPTLLSPSSGARRIAFVPDDFSWTAVPGAATYLFEISTDPTFSTLIYHETTIKPHHTPTKRLANNTYYWRVTPVDAQSHLGHSSEVLSFVFQWDVAPQLLTPENNLTTAYTPYLSWTAVEAAKEYRVEIDTEDDFPSPSVCTCRSTDYTWEKNLSNDQEYFWRVKAIDDAGNSGPWSAIRHFRMKWDFAPKLLSPANSSTLQSYPFFNWTPIPGAERYHIQVDETTSFSNPIFDQMVYNVNRAAITKFKDRQIFADLDYYWRVRGVDAQDNVTPWSDNFSFRFGFTTSPNLVYPLNYYVPDSKNLPVHGEHTIAWPVFLWDTAHSWVDYGDSQNVMAPDYYSVTVSINPDFSLPLFKIETAGLSVAPTLEHPFESLQNGELYHWRVRAYRQGAQMGVDSIGFARIDTTLPQITRSDVISITYPVDGFEAVAVAPVLGWLPVNGASHYRLEISRSRNFANPVEVVHPQFVNYTPWQGQRNPIPFGTYWWRVRAESALDVPLGDWSEVRHFNVSVDLLNGNPFDFVTIPFPATILSTTADYDPASTKVAINSDVDTNQFQVGDLHVMLNRIELRPDNSNQFPRRFDEYSWVIAFETSSMITHTMQYGIYIDINHQDGVGANVDPQGKPISVQALYRPEYVIYAPRIFENQGMPESVDPTSILVYRWNGTAWNPPQALASMGGDAWYSSGEQAVQIEFPYTSVGGGDANFAGSLAVTVFSTDLTPGLGIVDSVPRQGGELDNPVFVSDMLMPLYPFDTPLSNPSVHYDLPTLRWRMPYFDSVDGYQVQIARDAKFTDIVETWDIFEQLTAPYFAFLTAAFQSTQAYEDNESYYWRVRVRHERFDSVVVSRFDYGHWSPGMRFKLTSREVEDPMVFTETLAGTTPSFHWKRVEGAGGYTVQVDDDSNFSDPEIERKIDLTEYASLGALWDGTWYWRVATRRSDKVRGTWTDTMSFIKHSAPPTPLGPIKEMVLNEQPTFQWTVVLTPTTMPRLSAARYRIQVDDDSNFGSPKTYETDATSYTLKPIESLTDGTWYWRVAMIDGANNIGTYSPTQLFYKEYLTPTLLAPTQGETVTGVSSFQWAPLAGAAYYELEIAGDQLFNSPIRIKTENTQYTPVIAMKPKDYYWRVRMVDANRKPGPFQGGRVTIQEPIDPGQNRLYLPIVTK